MAEKSTSEVSHLQVRVQQAAAVMKVTEEVVWKGLSELGIDKDDEDGIALLEAETTKESDFRKIFVDNGVSIALDDDCPSVRETIRVKPLRFSAGWTILKGKTEANWKNLKEKVDEGGVAQLIQSFRPVHTYKDRELLEQYNPEASSEIINELLKRSNGRPFIIYKEDGETIDQGNTVLMLRTARRHETKQYHALLRENGSTEQVRLYRADEFPKTWLEECPLHPGVMLTDGYCDKCSDTWKGVDEAYRVIARVARDIGAVKSGLADAHELIEKLRTHGSKQLLKIPAVNRRYNELREENNLPKLKKRLSATSNGKQDPLFQHKIY